MQYIILDELKRSFITIKSIVIIGTFFLIDYYIDKYSVLVKALAGSGAALNLLFSAIAIFATLFAFMLFSGIISRDVESSAIRYILPYMKRWKLIISKYVAMNLYFISLFLVTLLILSVTKHFSFPVEEAFNMIIFFAYVQALVLLLSSLMKERMSLFVGLAVGFAFPVLYAITAHSKNVIYQSISWLLPFRYIKAQWEILGLIGITSAIILVTVYLFNQKEV